MGLGIGGVKAGGPGAGVVGGAGVGPAMGGANAMVSQKDLARKSGKI